MLIAPSGPPPSDQPPAQAAKLWKSAQDFEAMTIGQLLQPMFDTVPGDNAFGGGDTEQAFKPVMIQAIGRAMEEHGGLGLAGSIYQALLQAQSEIGRGGHVGASEPRSEPLEEKRKS